MAQRYWYDTEFVEDGQTIDLVSIGIVAEDGRELYLVSGEFDESKLKANPWLVENVWPSLPRKQHAPGLMCRCVHGHLDRDHPDVRTRAQIARAVGDFLVPPGITFAAGETAELWADYGAYDHVALAQLFGRMIDLPEGVPMWTNDLRQELRRLGNPPMPEQAAGHHNALADARHLKAMHDHLTTLS